MGYFSDRAYWEQWFPADFVVEALPGQFRNWFYALLAVSTMMVGRSPFKVLKGHGLVMDDEGKPMHKSAGNAIEFNEAADSIGVDVMRWLYAQTPPERNVLFGPHHCDDVRKDVILPWWNVYSFFCNLARVDDFKPEVHTAKADERSLLDRWILSDLHNLITTAHEAYSKFDVGSLCADAARFIDVLSTWYVRRSRRRFYGETWSADKRAAYSTLYEVLVTLNRVIAPIVPFVAESIYQNLVGNQHGDVPASVHHVPFPQADPKLIDEALSAHVAASLKVVSLARSARKDANLKIRQPLAEMLVVPANDDERQSLQRFEDHIRDELNVKKLTPRDGDDGLCTYEVCAQMKALGPKFGRGAGAVRDAIAKLDGRKVEEAFAKGESLMLTVGDQVVAVTPETAAIVKTFGADWAGASDRGTTVMLDRRITAELRNEGIARDIVRNVQNLRKEAGLDIADRIKLSLMTESAMLRDAIRQSREYIAGETLAVQVTDEPLRTSNPKTTVEIEGRQNAVTIGVEKV
jgi:isoleucyl-tRNA synthetase